METIMSPDGTAYMTLPPAVPSSGDEEEWLVRQVWTGTHSPSCPHGKSQGTRGGVSVDVRSLNSLLALVASLSADAGYRPRSARIGVSHFRWSWEYVLPDGHRMTDMIIANKIN